MFDQHSIQKFNMNLVIDEECNVSNQIATIEWGMTCYENFPCITQNPIDPFEKTGDSHQRVRLCR